MCFDSDKLFRNNEDESKLCMNTLRNCFDVYAALFISLIISNVNEEIGSQK